MEEGKDGGEEKREKRSCLMEWGIGKERKRKRKRGGGEKRQKKGSMK